MAMDALSREQSWKNRRKRSLYVEEGYAGFIFYRKSKASRGKGDTDDEKTITPQETSGENLPVESEDQALDNEDSPLSEKQLERLVEVKSFVDQIRRDVRTKGIDISNDKLEEVCGELYAELRAEVIADSGSYIQYLEATEEEKELPPHPMDAQLSESIRQLRQKIELFERETVEWEDLMKAKKMKSQETEHDLESNLSVDWRELGTEDGAKLATHLSQQHRDWLEHATSQRSDAEWEQRTEEDMRTVTSRIDRELERIQAYSDSVLQKCAVDTSKLIVGANEPTETPRTLLRALKNAH